MSRGLGTVKSPVHLQNTDGRIARIPNDKLQAVARSRDEKITLDQLNPGILGSSVATNFVKNHVNNRVIL